MVARASEFQIFPERTGPVRITLRLCDGSTRHGRLARFNPASADLPVEIFVKPGDDAKVSRMLMAAERIAAIGFVRDHDAPRSRRSPDDRIEVRVHLVGGGDVLAAASLEATNHPLGFYAIPLAPDDPHVDWFFYQHGVHAKEDTKPLGALLVQQGLVEQKELDRGLEVHRSMKPPLGQILVEQQVVPKEAVEAAATANRGKPMRIGEILVEAGLASKEDIELALAEQKKRSGKRLGEVLVELGIVKEIDIARTLSQKFHLPFVDLDQISVDPAAVKVASTELLEKQGVLPIQADGSSITVAMADPLAMQAVDLLRFQSKKRVKEVVVTPSQLRRAISHALAERERAKVDGEMESILAELADQDEREAKAAAAEKGEAAKLGETDSAVIRLVNQIVLEAYKRGASDIHVEPNGRERATWVRFRIDGDCVPYQEIPSTFRAALVSRIKIMANLDISERRKPQDGKIRFRLREKQIELRVATIPTVDENEDVVMRILAASKPMPLSDLGMSERNLRELRAAIKKPYGLFLCVGPTGSGKTTTLHSVLGEINTADMKIWTAEDPVEITQAGLRQVQVQPKIGFTFAAAMRAFLRADPDVIMVGEMRDHETASTGIEASLTGHLVFSTLHTNSAPETVTRLLDMGLEPFSFADALVGVLAQRLARAICKGCRQPRPGTAADWKEIVRAFGSEEDAFAVVGHGLGPEFKMWHGVGCEACGGSGYKGRVALHELLIADDETKRLVQKKSPVETVRAQAMAAGMTTLLQDGIEKALRGLTDLRQVLAVADR
jgi:type II secretory ATPase GspE/PulE/Tfp pilus assembly ATPase PilB-like protein